MSYKLRFVQRFQASHEKEFMELERAFAQLERKYADFPKGRRFRTYAGREATNTLIWECDFPTLEAAQRALQFFAQDSRHEKLFRKQAPYFLDAYTEIYEEILKCT